jgi:hypothetical protein
MSCGHNNVLKVADSVSFRCQIGESHLKLSFFLPILHVPRYLVERNKLSKVLLLKPSHEISSKNIPWQIRRHRLSEMFFESVVWKLEAFFRKVGPQLTVHTRMHMLSVLVGSTPPCVVPLSAPVWLLLDADYLVFLGG